MTQDSSPVPLSRETVRRLELLFAPDTQELAGLLLTLNCGNNLPFHDSQSSTSLERVRFAALKLSEGRLDRLEEAIKLAQTDWRDLLVAAGFAHDVEAHLNWLPAASS